MKMTGEYALAAPRQEVWQALNDPAVLKDCIPGCESITKLSDTEMEAAAKMKVGPVSARFKGKVTLSDLDPPNSYTITGEGSGGAAGFAKGGAKVNLTDGENGGTVLRYDVEAQVGGKLAQVGQRLVDQTAKKMADEFFARFADKVGRAPEIPAPAAAVAEPVAVQPAALSTAPQTPSMPGPPTDRDAIQAAAAAQSSATQASAPNPAAQPSPVPVLSPESAARSDAKSAQGIGNVSRWVAIILLVLLVLLLVYYIRN